jgi:hypothetical protein
MRKTLPPTEENIRRAKAFVLRRWKERAKEMGRPEPTDLSNACKFASLFAQRLFGGRLRGNWHHQWAEVRGQIVDLTDAAGVDLPPEEIYEHDDDFWMNDEHEASLATCRPRVETWVNFFRKPPRT